MSDPVPKQGRVTYIYVSANFHLSFDCWRIFQFFILNFRLYWLNYLISVCYFIEFVDYKWWFFRVFRFCFKCESLKSIENKRIEFASTPLVIKQKHGTSSGWWDERISRLHFGYQKLWVLTFTALNRSAWSASIFFLWNVYNLARIYTSFA